MEWFTLSTLPHSSGNSGKEKKIQRPSFPLGIPIPSLG